MSTHPLCCPRFTSSLLAAFAVLALSAPVASAQSFRVSVGDAALDFVVDEATRSVTVNPVLDPEVRRALGWREYAHLGPEVTMALREIAQALMEFQESVAIGGEPGDDDFQGLLEALEPPMARLGIDIPSQGAAMERVEGALWELDELAPRGAMALISTYEMEMIEAERTARYGATSTSEVLRLHPDLPLLHAREGLFDTTDPFLPGRDVTGPEHTTRYLARIGDGAVELETESEAEGEARSTVPLPGDLPSGPFLDGLFGLALLPFQDLAATGGEALVFPVVNLEPDLLIETGGEPEPRIEISIIPNFGRLELRDATPETLRVGGGVEVAALRFDAVASGDADPFMGLFPVPPGGEARVTLWVRAESPHAMLRIRSDDGMEVWGHLVGDTSVSPEGWANWLAGGGG